MIKLVNRTFSFHYHDDDDDDVGRRLVNFQGGQGSAFVPGSVRIGVDINLVVLMLEAWGQRWYSPVASRIMRCQQSLKFHNIQRISSTTPHRTVREGRNDRDELKA